MNVAAVPSEMYEPIGLVVANWGAFEADFDRVIDRIIRSKNPSWASRSWRKSSFKERAKLLRKLVREFCSHLIADEFSRLIGEARQVQEKRNLIAHGHFRLHPTSAETYVIQAVDERTDPPVIVEVTCDSLTAIFREIVVLRSTMVHCFDLSECPGHPMTTDQRKELSMLVGGPLIEPMQWLQTE